MFKYVNYTVYVVHTLFVNVILQPGLGIKLQLVDFGYIYNSITLDMANMEHERPPDEIGPPPSKRRKPNVCSSLKFPQFRESTKKLIVLIRFIFLLDWFGIGIRTCSIYTKR